MSTDKLTVKEVGDFLKRAGMKAYEKKDDKKLIHIAITVEYLYTLVIKNKTENELAKKWGPFENRVKRILLWVEEWEKEETNV